MLTAQFPPQSPPPPYESLDNAVTSLQVTYAQPTPIRLSIATDSPWVSSSPNNPQSNLPFDDIPALRLELHSLESKMRNLLTQRDAIESRLSRAVAAQSPVRRLPAEILACIFAIGVRELDEEDPLFLAKVTLVCRHWRDVAYATPELWSSIEISENHSLGKAKRRLERSRAVPLDIVISFGGRTQGIIAPDSFTAKAISKAMELVQPSINRWKSFKLRVPNRPHANAALIACNEPAPLLRDISIQVNNSMQEDDYSSPPLPIFQGIMPSLRSCSFSSFNFRWSPSFSNLEDLKLCGFWQEKAPSFPQFITLIAASPRLVNLSLRNMADVDADDEGSSSLTHRRFVAPPPSTTSSPILVLSHLKTMSFYYSGVVRTRQLLGQVCFPALERLEISYLDNITGILQVLHRQAVQGILPLRWLHIEACFFSELKLMQLLHRLPWLETLELVDCEDVSENFFKGMSTPHHAHEWICPRLERLSVEGCSGVEWDSLRSLIDSRLPHNIPFYLPSDNHRLVTPHPCRSESSLSITGSAPPLPPKKIGTLDLTRCNQITREMVQWLKMSVDEVSCETTKGTWP